jgi:hypothetical protein
MQPKRYDICHNIHKQTPRPTRPEQPRAAFADRISDKLSGIMGGANPADQKASNPGPIFFVARPLRMR